MARLGTIAKVLLAVVLVSVFKQIYDNASIRRSPASFSSEEMDKIVAFLNSFPKSKQPAQKLNGDSVHENVSHTTKIFRNDTEFDPRHCEEDWSLKKKAEFMEYHEKCGEMTGKGVHVGKTWGHLESSRYDEWKSRRCDQYWRWHRTGEGTSGWHQSEIITHDELTSLDKNKCCKFCADLSECQSFAEYRGKCYLRSKTFNLVNKSSEFPFACEEYSLTDCYTNEQIDKIRFDMGGVYFRDSARPQNGGMIYHIQKSSQTHWTLILQLQLLPAMWFKTEDGGKTFKGGYKGQHTGMVLTSTCDSHSEDKKYPKNICPDKHKLPSVPLPIDGSEKACYSSNSENATQNLHRRMENLGYTKWVRIKHAHPGYAPPECDQFSASNGIGLEKLSKLSLVLPGTLRSFEHLIDHLYDWVTKTNGNCYFVSIAVDPRVDIAIDQWDDPAVNDFIKASPNYAVHILTYAQKIFGGRLSYIIYDRLNWNCVGGGPCQRWAIPMGLEALKWGLCHLNTELKDHDVIVKTRPDIHYREFLDLPRLGTYLRDKPNTLFWMRKVKSRWSKFDDPTDQIVIGGKIAMEAWIGHFSHTLKHCGVVKSDWLGIAGVYHRLIDPRSFNFCMVRHTGILDDSTKLCNTQPYPGNFPRITWQGAVLSELITDVTKNLKCLTKINSGSPPPNTETVDIQWRAIVGDGVCEHQGPYPWESREIGDYKKDLCDAPF